MPYPRYFMQQLLDHLYVVGQAPPGGGLKFTDCHVYLVRGERVAIAIDAGSGGLWPLARAAMERYGFADLPISHVLVTHGHGDHARGLTEFEGQGALTTCSAYTAQHLDSKEDADVIFERDGFLDLGEFRPQVVLTPGHTPGCASYRLVVDGALCLFTGDLIQLDGGLGWCGSEGFSQDDALKSLKKLAAMPAPDILGLGHAFVEQGGSEVLKKGIAYGEGGQWIVWTEERPVMP